jgi:hypothetical protein
MSKGFFEVLFVTMYEVTVIRDLSTLDLYFVHRALASIRASPLAALVLVPI